jgi:Tfp pilus assembly protein PilF
MLTVVVRYLGLIFRPTELSALYMPPMKMRIDATVGWSALLVCFLIAVGIYLFRRRKDLFFWFALFFVGLLPVSQIVSLVTLMNDRYLYFPLLGVGAFYGIFALPPPNAGYDLRKKSIALILGLLVIPLPWLSWQRIPVWSNDLTLWVDTTRKTPSSPLAWSGLGMSFVDAKRYDEAANAFLEALSIDPNDKFALNNIGALYNSQGKISEARPFLLRVIEFFPDDFNGLMNLGINYYLSHELQNAELTFKKVLTLQPQSPQALSRLGDVYLGMRKLEMARRQYQEAIEKGGSTGYLEYRLARLEALSAHPREALERLEAALRMGYNDFQNITEDAALDALRGLADFQTLIHKYSGK